MNKTLADLIVDEHSTEMVLPSGRAQPADETYARGVVATNGPFSVLHVPYALPTIVSKGNRSLERFAPGDEVIDLFVLGQHRYKAGHGHRIHVHGFVPSIGAVKTHPNGSLSTAAYVEPEDMAQFVRQFDAPLDKEGLVGTTLGDYVLGPTFRMPSSTVPMTAKILSISNVTIDRAIREALKENPELMPYAGTVDTVFYRLPKPVEHRND